MLNVGIPAKPTTKKTPPKRPRGIVWRTVRRGPVMTPIRPRVMRMWERRCSRTWRGIIFLRWWICQDEEDGEREESESESSSQDFSLVMVRVSEYSVRESVWTGAWGMRPLGKGMPMMPPTKQVMPRRKKSQWKPAGFLRGNCRACAVRELTL